jgi:MFS family permease
MLLLMIPLATTELGTDSWISDLMAPEMASIGLQAGWILVYTSAIMAVLRLFAGEMFKRITPLGLLAICSGIAAIGLFLLSTSDGIMILVAATVFGLGKTFFWPTMLGVVAERFPKGGALTLNITGGVGMIGAGVIGAVILGFVQDKEIDANLQAFDNINQTSLHSAYVTESKQSIFGDYQALDMSLLQTATPEEKEAVLTVTEGAKKEALKTIAIFPIGMMLCYLALMLYFRYKGGYKVVLFQTEQAVQPESTK